MKNTKKQVFSKKILFFENSIFPWLSIPFSSLYGVSLFGGDLTENFFSKKTYKQKLKKYLINTIKVSRKLFAVYHFVYGLLHDVILLKDDSDFATGGG